MVLKRVRAFAVGAPMKQLFLLSGNTTLPPEHRAQDVSFDDISWEVEVLKVGRWMRGAVPLCDENTGDFFTGQPDTQTSNTRAAHTGCAYCKQRFEQIGYQPGIDWKFSSL